MARFMNNIWEFLRETAITVGITLLLPMAFNDGFKLIKSVPNRPEMPSFEGPKEGKEYEEYQEKMEVNKVLENEYDIKIANYKSIYFYAALIVSGIAIFLGALVKVGFIGCGLISGGIIIL